MADNNNAIWDKLPKTPYPELKKFDLRSHLMEINGGNFTYTYDIEGDTLWYWFGDKDSDNFNRGTFSKDGNTITGRWQWPEGAGKAGGYKYTTRMLRSQKGYDCNASNG